MREITLAITHHNRYWFLLECIDDVLHDERIREIVIVDDCSTDGSYEKLTAHFASNPKVKIFRNETNLDCYRNKREAIAKSTSDWVILFDSDNVITKAYLDALYRIESWDPRVIYCPDFAQPHFDYTAFADRLIDRHQLRRIYDADPPIPPLSVRRRTIRVPPPANGSVRYGTLLNTCNYFVFRPGYLEVWDGSVDPHTADTIYQAYNWLKSGRSVFVVPGLRYHHRIHEESHYKKNKHLTGNFLFEVEQKLKALV